MYRYFGKQREHFLLNLFIKVLAYEQLLSNYNSSS